MHSASLLSVLNALASTIQSNIYILVAKEYKKYRYKYTVKPLYFAAIKCFDLRYKSIFVYFIFKIYQTTKLCKLDEEAGRIKETDELVKVSQDCEA